MAPDQPAPGQWDFSWADRPLERLLELGIQPVVDLVHYGLPGWIEGAYLHPDFAEYMAEYAGRVAERYRGRIQTYTPLNEPRVTAWYCGRLGWWPPFRRGWRGFVLVMLGVCRGIVQDGRALRSVDPEIVDVHVDATDLYATSCTRTRQPKLRADRRSCSWRSISSAAASAGAPTARVAARHGAEPSQPRRFESQPDSTST